MNVLGTRIAPALAALAIAWTTLAVNAAGTLSHEVKPLVDGQWMQAHLDNDAVVVLDVRNKLDGGSRATYEQGHIPGAVYSDYLNDGWRIKVDGVVGMLPPIDRIETLIGSLGIGNDNHVVIVPDGVSALDYGSATRVYWTFKVLGHEAVSILDGGHTLWVKEGRPVERGIVKRPPVSFSATYQPRHLADRNAVLAASTRANALTLVDNRPKAQYMGRGKHAMATRAGAIPNAVNVPQERFFDAGSGRFSSTEKLAALWTQAGGSDGETITYCNTGHWASLGWFASSELLGRQSRLYDGSMVEWSSREELPMVRAQ
ncbi:MAG: sulfurtransferase [Gammaproteobacteria bacterium]